MGTLLAPVSRKLSELGSHPGSRLLIRTSRGLALTEAGRAFVAAARRIFDDMDEIERSASGEDRSPRAHLPINASITGPIMFGRLHVEPIILELLKIHPDITVRLILADHVVDLVDEQIDCALHIVPLPNGSMLVTGLGRVNWGNVASPDNLATRGMADTPFALSKDDCPMFEVLDSVAASSFERGDTATSSPVPCLCTLSMYANRSCHQNCVHFLISQPRG